jgi:hypothetical protein
MRLELPSANIAHAGLFCVIIQGLKSSSRFSLFASVRVLRRWTSVECTLNGLNRLVNVDLVWDHFQLPTLLPRLLRLIVVPEPEVIIDILNVMRVLTKCQKDSEELCEVAGQSRPVIEALICLLFTRVRCRMIT